MAAKSPKEELKRLNVIHDAFANNLEEDLKFIREQQTQSLEEGPDIDAMQGQLIRMTRIVGTLTELLWSYDEVLAAVVNGKINRDPADTIENRFKEFPY